MRSQVMLVGLGTSAALALAMMLGASTASADLGKCQKKLYGPAGKYNVACSKGVLKCLDSIRKNGATAKAADACEKALGKVIGAEGARAKAVEKLSTVDDGGVEAVCQDADLQNLGFLVGGAVNSAPGANSADWAVSWLLKAKEALCLEEAIYDVGDWRNLLNSVIQLGPDPVECVGGEGDCGTDCTGAPPAGTVTRPNLCAFRAAFEPECQAHACALSGASGAVLNPIGAPIGLSGRKLVVDVCNLPATGLPVSGNDVLGLLTSPTNALKPNPVVPVVPAITVCAVQLRGQGWCDKSAAAPNMRFNVQFCIDHISDAGGSCAGEPNSSCTDEGIPFSCCTDVNEGCDDTESNCICSVGAPLGTPCSTPGCTSCVTSTTGARCHPGTETSSLDISFTGVSTANTCVNLNTIQFGLLPPAICVNAMGQALGQCAVAGPADAGCVMVGGVACADSRGPDLQACTPDDLPPAGAPTTVPFSTGTSTSTIEDFVSVEGSCAGGTTPGMNCATDPDCGGGGTCAGLVTGCGTGPNAEDCQYTSGPGVPIGATLIQSSNLGGWAIVGTFPALDGNAPLNETVTSFTLVCS